MADRQTVGVVTVTYNSAEVIDEFLQSLLAQTHRDFVLFIVDNASADGTLHRLKSYSDPRIRVIANRENLGVAEGNNQGIAAARHEACQAVLLINNDTVFEPGLIEKLLRGLGQFPCDMVVPKMMYYQPPQTIWCAGGAFSRLRGYSAVHYGEGAIDRGQFNEPREVEYTPTCCMLIRSSVFDSIGIMDRRYFVYFDDVDFVFRAGKAGHKLFYLPEATLQHKVNSLTGGPDLPFALRFHTRNHVFFILKNLGAIAKVAYLLLLQAYMLGRLLLAIDTYRIFRIREKAFFEGFQVSKQDV